MYYAGGNPELPVHVDAVKDCSGIILILYVEEGECKYFLPFRLSPFFLIQDG